MSGRVISSKTLLIVAYITFGMPTAYVVMPDHLRVCHGGDEPSNWEVRDRLAGDQYELTCIAVSPDESERLFVGTFENDILRSRDGGETFERLELDPAFESDRIMSLSVSPHDATVVYAGTEPSRVYRSTDAGESWTHLEGISDLPSEPEWYFPPRPDTHHVRWIEIDPTDPDRLYVGIELGALVLSTDGGETWTERPPGSRLDNHSLAVHADRPGRVYTAAGDGYAESDDGGESWRRPQSGLDHRYCWSVRPDPGDPDRVIVSSANGASTAHTQETADSYVYRKQDDRWTQLDGRGMPMGRGVVRATFATTDEPAVIYGLNNRGLFRSVDFGDTWTGLDISWPNALTKQTPRGLAVVSESESGE